MFYLNFEFQLQTCWDRYYLETDQLHIQDLDFLMKRQKKGLEQGHI